MKRVIFTILYLSFIISLQAQVNAYDRYQPSGIRNYTPAPSYNGGNRVQGYYIKGYKETDSRSYFDNNNIDQIEGIWQSTDGFKYSIEKDVEGGVRVSNSYRMVVIISDLAQWRAGQIKAFIEPSSNGIYSVKYYTSDGNYTYQQNCIGFLENILLFTFTRSDNGDKIGLAKLYPDEAKKIRERQAEAERIRIQEENQKREQEEANRKKEIENAVKSGTGFAISSNGYIATNYHVIEKAKSIEVKGINGNYSKKFRADVVISDKTNDLAILKINDPSFSSLGMPPYIFRIGTAEIGENIFALGYPMTRIMGEEIKLTNGIINSKTGFQGDVSTYQISVQIQPGNSGGPLFGNNGNLIGITSAGLNRELLQTENVNYAIKIKYLKDLIDLLPQKINLTTTNLLLGKSLSEQAKLASKFTYMIIINDNTNVNNQTGVYNSSASNSNYGVETNNGIIITNPTYYSSQSHTKIRKITINNLQTVFEIEFTTPVANWCNIDKKTFIADTEYEFYNYMIKAENIKYAPEKTVLNANSKLVFKLIFPPLPKDITTLNLIENESSSLKFYNIRIK